MSVTPDRERRFRQTISVPASSSGRLAIMRTPTFWDITRSTLWRWTRRLKQSAPDAYLSKILLDAAIAMRCGDFEGAAALLAPRQSTLGGHPAYLNLLKRNQRIKTAMESRRPFLWVGDELRSWLFAGRERTCVGSTSRTPLVAPLGR